MSRANRHPGVLQACAVTAVIALAGGCRKNGPQGGPFTLDAPPSYGELAERHNQRVALLDTLYADGVIELKWRDEQGRHAEQGDLDLWLRMPDCTAMQVSKMGERFFWLGSNQEASWMFDFRASDAPIAAIHPPHAMLAADDAVVSVSLTDLLEMMGLAPIPLTPPSDAPAIQYDKRTRAWVMHAQGSAGPLRMYYDGRRLLPVRIELINADAADAEDSSVLLFSTLYLERYEYVSIAGRSPDQFPLVPTLIDLERADGEGMLKIAVNKPVVKDDSFREDYFNLDWLLAAFQPVEVRDHRDSSPGEAASPLEPSAEGRNHE